MTLFFIASFTFTLAFLLTPVVRWVAINLHVIAQENHRTIHNGPIPRLGGVAVGIAFLGACALYLSLAENMTAATLSRATGIMTGGLLILLVGVFDDIKGLSCYAKLTLQILAAVVAIIFDIKINYLVLPFIGTIHSGIFSQAFTILWIVGLTNALNLIDGLDGLATGVTMLVAFTLFICGVVFGSPLAAFAIILAGAMIGFLPFNYRPARIFLGDSGSLLLGFLLSCLSIEMAGTAPGALQLMIPVIALALPILDTFLAIFRRIKRHEHPFHADREHIHHRLLLNGFSQKKSVQILWTATFVLQFFALSLLWNSRYLTGVIFILVNVALVLVLKRLHQLRLAISSGS